MTSPSPEHSALEGLDAWWGLYKALVAAIMEDGASIGPRAPHIERVLAEQTVTVKALMDRAMKRALATAAVSA